MDTVCVLHPVRADDEHGDDAKLIGIYRSRAGAKAAVRRLAVLPGFRDQPDGFQFGACQLDEDHWTEDFATE